MSPNQQCYCTEKGNSRYQLHQGKSSFLHSPSDYWRKGRRTITFDAGTCTFERQKTQKCHICYSQKYFTISRHFVYHAHCSAIISTVRYAAAGVFTGWMPTSSHNQQHQSTKDTGVSYYQHLLRLYVHLFSLGELRVNKLPIQYAGAVGCRGQQPQHEYYLQFVVEWNPATAADVKPVHHRSLNMHCFARTHVLLTVR